MLHNIGKNSVLREGTEANRDLNSASSSQQTASSAEVQILPVRTLSAREVWEERLKRAYQIAFLFYTPLFALYVVGFWLAHIHEIIANFNIPWR